MTTSVAAGSRQPARGASVLFAAAILTSAALVFLVQPMIARMLLPRLGGSPAVWNTSMVFFQAALLLGYGYAHLLQRLTDLRAQVAVHLVLLGLASLALPLAIAKGLGDPNPQAPILWLLAALALSVGAPFAALSATAPLLQSWFARLQGEGETRSPYGLYVASNLGSMAALIGYPTLVEPLLELERQTMLWAFGYGLFALMVAGLGLMIFTAGPRAHSAVVATIVSEPAPTWKSRLIWLALAAAPASLLLGVTAYISTDVAAAPFLWVLPLALYLLTFIIAFQERPLIAPKVALIGQLVLAPLCILSLTTLLNWWLMLALHLGAFFFSALVCHQAMAARRPAAARLTQFYLYVSLGGVLGGAATSLLAPLIFDRVLEYPLVLLLAGLARPWPKAKGPKAYTVISLVALSAAAVSLAFVPPGPLLTWWVGAIVFAVLVGAVILKTGPLIAILALVILLLQSYSLARASQIHAARSFFGVHRVLEDHSPTLGPLIQLSHGTTVHGAQPRTDALRCTPLSYYARSGAIADAYELLAATRPAMTTGVVGLGAGSTATYLRPTDRMVFFEIDPLVERIARNRAYFTYLSDCAAGGVHVVLGDARLTLAKEPPASFDFIVLDAFTSDAIPTHLLTVEALGQYLSVLKPDGVVLFHTSNRHLKLEGILAAAAARVGAQAYGQQYRPTRAEHDRGADASDVVVIARSPQALAPFATSPRWTRLYPRDARPWTDDYTNVLGALLAGEGR